MVSSAPSPGSAATPDPRHQVLREQNLHEVQQTPGVHRLATAAGAWPLELLDRKETVSATIQSELDFERCLRNRIMEAIDEQGLSADEVAQRADMIPSGVAALFRRAAWPLPVALRVANGLGLEIRPVVEPR